MSAFGPLFLSGPMGAGKSALGRRVARHLGLEFLDLDALIVAREGLTIPALFAEGEERFRRAEREALGALLSEREAGPAYVLALGGGTLGDPQSLAALERAGTLVGLRASATTLASRLGAEARASRPLLAGADDPRAALEELLARREADYARAALRVDTDELDEAGAALALLWTLYEPRRGPWRAEARPLGAEFEAAGRVSAGRGAFPFACEAGWSLLVDDALPAPALAALEARLEGREAPRVRLSRQGGEGAKSVDSLARGWAELLEAGVDRDGSLLVVGGGSLSDLGGMLADTYKRGITCELLPTTLLAQLDAALGGKNGINVAATKNAAGTIRLPRQVHLDPLWLLSLPAAELRGGLAEAVKSALIGDVELFELLSAEAGALAEGQLPSLEAVAERSARVKLAIVAEDLRESGLRRLLNFGHTLGHALEGEAARAGVSMSHGDAVAIGMVFATRLARRVGVLEEPSLGERLVAALVALGLPSAIPASLTFEAEALCAAIARDKKRARGENLFVLPRRAGELVVRPVGDPDLRAELDAFLGEAR